MTFLSLCILSVLCVFVVLLLSRSTTKAQELTQIAQRQSNPTALKGLQE